MSRYSLIILPILLFTACRTTGLETPAKIKEQESFGDEMAVGSPGPSTALSGRQPKPTSPPPPDREDLQSLIDQFLHPELDQSKPDPENPTGATPIEHEDSLTTDGPYLVYTKRESGVQLLVMTDYDGTGRKVIAIPENGFVPDLENAISASGSWLAFFTGDPDTPNTLSLKIMNLRDQSVQVVAEALAPDYPQNLEVLAEALVSQDPDYAAMNEEYGLAGILAWGFRNGIQALDWSPQGDMLAFTAQMEGPALDLYLFEVGKDGHHRLTNTSENIERIDWSPDGNWILFEQDYPDPIYGLNTLHALQPEVGPISDSPILKNPNFCQRGPWIDDTRLLIHNCNHTGPGGFLGVLNLQSGNITTLWSDVYYEDFLYDRENHLLIVSSAASGYTFGSERPHMADGTYAVSMDGSWRSLTDHFYWNLWYQPQNRLPYIGSDGEALYAFNAHGTTRQVFEQANLDVYPSPDGAWLAFDGGGQLMVVDRDFHLQYSFPIDVFRIFWRPDSGGMFLTRYNELLYVDFESGDLKTIDRCQHESCHIEEYQMVWAPALSLD